MSKTAKLPLEHPQAKCLLDSHVTLVKMQSGGLDSKAAELK